MRLSLETVLRKHAYRRHVWRDLCLQDGNTRVVIGGARQRAHAFEEPAARGELSRVPAHALTEGDAGEALASDAQQVLEMRGHECDALGRRGRRKRVL